MARAIRSSDRTQTDLRAELLSIEGVSVGYGDQMVIEDVTFNVRRGEVAGLVALDGRGKSTLIRCAGGLLQPASGRVLYEGRDVYEMSFADDQRFRTRSAIVLEGGALFQNRSIIDNLTLPIRYHLGGKLEDAQEYGRRLLDRVGYNESHLAFPFQVSARGRRLASFARALVREPELVLVDRFFESLDVADTKRLMELVLELNVKNGTSFLLVGRLHPTIFQVAERVVVLEGGKLVAHDFKRGLYKNDHIKRAFEEGEEEAASSKPLTQTSERRRAEAAAPRPPTAVEVVTVVPLDTGSEGFDPQSDSDLQPIVVVGEQPSDEAPIEPADDEDSALENAGPETTITIPAEAAETLVAEARERAARKIEAEAAATESAVPSNAVPSKVLDRRALEAALRVADEQDQASPRENEKTPQDTKRAGDAGPAEVE